MHKQRSAFQAPSYLQIKARLCFVSVRTSATMAGDDANNSSYFNKLRDSFVGHFEAYQKNPNDSDGQKRRPVDFDRYFDEEDGEQSNTCSRLAVQFYNQQPDINSPISLLYAKDSHKFCVDEVAYYHVNFKAESRGQPYTFFAEVTGKEDPDTVTMVTLFLTKEERKTRDNCLYCTGLRHPKEGGFVGHEPQAED